VKQEIITKKGEIENYVYFILKGLIRKYYIKYKQEHNIQISYEGHLIHSQESFHSRKPSKYYVETIEPSTLVAIHYDDLEKLYDSSRKLEHLGRLIITYTMVLKDSWKDQLIELSSKERFLNFVNKHPEMLQRVPQKFLASYLNMSAETFSRFKHIILKKKKLP
jgi:CRP-like cAMP-binding protein